MDSNQKRSNTFLDLRHRAAPPPRPLGSARPISLDAFSEYYEDNTAQPPQSTSEQSTIKTQPTVELQNERTPEKGRRRKKIPKPRIGGAGRWLDIVIIIILTSLASSFLTVMFLKKYNYFRSSTAKSTSKEQ